MYLLVVLSFLFHRTNQEEEEEKKRKCVKICLSFVSRTVAVRLFVRSLFFPFRVCLCIYVHMNKDRTHAFRFRNKKRFQNDDDHVDASIIPTHCCLLLF